MRCHVSLERLVIVLGLRLHRTALNVLPESTALITVSTSVRMPGMKYGND